MWALPPPSAVAIGGLSRRRWTNEDPGSCGPLKPRGNVRGWAHRWAGEAGLRWAGRRGRKFLLPGGREPGKKKKKRVGGGTVAFDGLRCWGFLGGEEEEGETITFIYISL